MYSELKKVSIKLHKRIKSKNSESFLAWVSGTAVDFLKGIEPYDYDLVVSGVSKKEVRKILEDEFRKVNYDKNSNVLNAYVDSGKKIDVICNGLFSFNTQKNNWDYGKLYFDFTSSKSSINPIDILKTQLEVGAGRFSNRSICYTFPELELVGKKGWVNDIKNKKTEVLKSESRYVFYDYMRLFRFSSMGYEIRDKTYRWMVENSLIDYLVWKNRKVEPDKISEYQDSLLKYILKVFEQKERGLECKADNFYNLCVETSLFSSLLGHDPEKVKRNEIKSPEEFLLKIYGNRKSIEEEIGKHHIYKTGYFD